MNKALDYNKLHSIGINKENSYLNIEENFEEIRIFILKNVSRDAKILELGAGGGQFSNWLYLNGFTNLTVSDNSEVAVSLISRKFPYLTVQIIDAGDIDNNGFDVIIALDLVEHLKDVPKHLSMVDKALNPQGLYIIKTPNKFWEDIYYKKILLKKDKEKKHIWWRGHISLMTFNTLRKRLRKAGFSSQFIKQKNLTRAQEKKIKLAFSYLIAKLAIIIGNLILKITPKGLNIQFICIAKKEKQR